MDGRRVATIQIITTTDQLEAARRQLLAAMGVAGGLIVLVAALGGLFLADRALRPVDLRPQEAALLDGLEREARAALDAIKHARTREEANRLRGELRRKLEESLGLRRLPWPPDLQAATLGTAAQAGYSIEKLVWQTLPGVRGDNNDRFAYDREIPFFYVPWKGLLGPDIPDFLKATKARGTWEGAINGDWETRAP